MKHSESIAQLAASLAKAQGEMEHAHKDADNPYFKSKYADLAGCRDAIRQPFANNGLSIVQGPRVDENRVYVTTMLLHESGEWICEEASAVPKDFGPQSVGSVITYLRRYGLCSMSGLAADEDDDGNAGQSRNPASARKSNGNGSRVRKSDIMDGFHASLQESVAKYDAAAVARLYKALKEHVEKGEVSKDDAQKWGGKIFSFINLRLAQAGEEELAKLMTLANKLAANDPPLVNDSQLKSLNTRADARLETLESVNT